jgi:hypothetical protein
VSAVTGVTVPASRSPIVPSGVGIVWSLPPLSNCHVKARLGSLSFFEAVPARSQFSLSLAWRLPRGIPHIIVGEPRANGFSGHGNVLRTRQYHKARGSTRTQTLDVVSTNGCCGRLPSCGALRKLPSKSQDKGHQHPWMIQIRSRDVLQ